MRWNDLRPVHGWHVFCTELTVVVLGVMIALSAEQALSSLHRQGDVRSFRSAIDKELEWNLTAFNYRLAQDTCVGSRLAELRQLRDQALNGQSSGVVTEIGRPGVVTIKTSVWSARDPAVMGAMPLDLRLEYSALYDELAINYEQITQEREAWRSLARFNGARRLSEDDVRTLSELLFRAESIDRVLRSNSRDVAEKAGRVGVSASEETRRALGEADQTLCRPLLQ